MSAPSLSFLLLGNNAVRDGSRLVTMAKAVDAAEFSKMDEEVRESVMQIRGWLDRCE